MRLCKRKNESNALVSDCLPETTFSFVFPFRDSAGKDSVFTGISTAELTDDPVFTSQHGGVALCNAFGHLMTCLRVLYLSTTEASRNCRAALEFLPADESDRHDIRALRLVVELVGRYLCVCLRVPGSPRSSHQVSSDGQTQPLPHLG